MVVSKATDGRLTVLLIYLAAQRKNALNQEVGYGYTRYQVEQAFKDAGAFLRFWEPQKGIGFNDGKFNLGIARESCISFILYPKKTFPLAMC